MRLQKLAAVIALSGALCSGYSLALGVGELRVNSALNQPLDAQIELVDVGGLTRSEILPSLASRGDFERAGINRPLNLSDLRFEAVTRPDGTAYVHVTSSMAIQEPFLNILMELYWPNGRLLREYTFLLDPPVFTDQSAYAVEPATDTQRRTVATPLGRPQSVSHQTSGYEVVNDEMSDTSGSSMARPIVDMKPAMHPDRSSRRRAQVREYRVGSNEQLWNIARSVKPRGASVHQTMIAIQRKNPSAFLRDNINLVKKGHVLRIPDIREVRAVGYREAVAEVKMQNRAWKRQREQLDATRRPVVQKAKNQVPVADKLSIVGADNASGSGQDMGGGASNQKVKALQNKLAVTTEKMDQLSRENAELQSRLQDLSNQIETLRRLIELKDEQLSSLQHDMDQAAVVTDSMTDPMEYENQDVFVDYGEDSDDPEGAEESGLKWILGGVLALLIAVGGGYTYYRRKKSEGILEFDEELDFESDVSDDDKSESAEMNSDKSKEAEQAGEDNPVVQQTNDPLSEADIYIGYGRYDQAMELLQQALEKDDQNPELYLKLLTIYADTGDRNGFFDTHSKLASLNDKKAMQRADALRDKHFADSEEPLAEAETVEDVEVQDADELDFELNDLESVLVELENPSIEGVDELPDFDLDESDKAGLVDNESGQAPEGGEFDDALADLESSFANDEDDLDFFTDDDEVATKLDLARAYIDMGDKDGARDILEEVVSVGSDEQKMEAQALLNHL